MCSAATWLAGQPPRRQTPPAPTHPPSPPPPQEVPWWQTINRDRPRPTPRPPAPNPPPRAAPPPPTADPPLAAPTLAPSQAWKWVAAVAGVAVLIGAAAVGLAMTGPRTPQKVLDIATAQQQIEAILRDPLDGYGAQTVTGLACNGGINPPITRGAGFSCDAVVDGASRRVAVVFADDDGTYTVDRPR